MQCLTDVTPLKGSDPAGRCCYVRLGARARESSPLSPLSRTTWLAGPFAKIAKDTPRVRSVSQTARRALPIAKRIPMTRLADLGPLDRSRPHVFGAITPLAADLTTHLGKGETADAARVSAMMEAIERASAEASLTPCEVASFDECAGDDTPAIDPARFTLPPTTDFDPARAIRWSPARRLLDGQLVRMASDLVLSPPRDGVIHQPDTNGLASGNTVAEAVLHGLCEVIERDALGVDMFARLYADPHERPAERRLDPATLPAAAKTLLERAEAAGHRLALFDVTRDIGVPVIAAYLIDPAYPGPAGPAEHQFAGYGCAPSPHRALMRALTEAEQSRVCVLQGARDSFNTVPEGGTPKAVEGGATVDFSALKGAPASDDLRDDLGFVNGALAAVGLDEIYVSDLTQPRLGMPVVRVRVPGLSGFFVDRSRVGPRDLACLL